MVHSFLQGETMQEGRSANITSFDAYRSFASEWCNNLAHA